MPGGISHGDRPFLGFLAGRSAKGPLHYLRLGTVRLGEPLPPGVSSLTALFEPQRVDICAGNVARVHYST